MQVSTENQKTLKFPLQILKAKQFSTKRGKWPKKESTYSLEIETDTF